MQLLSTKTFCICCVVVMHDRHTCNANDILSLKPLGETVEAEKTDVEEEKDKTGEMKEMGDCGGRKD